MFEFCGCCNYAQRAVATTTATTTPAEGYTEVFVFLVDAAVVQNAVTSAASVASSPTSAFHLAPISAFSGVDVDDAGLKG